MKKINYISFLGRTLVTAALVGAMSSCVMERLDPNCENVGDGVLAVRSMVGEGTVVKAETTESDASLNERQLNTLDVFVEHVTNGTGDGTFLKQYHLVASTETPIQEAANNWLADNWRKEGLEIGQKYNIYVAANNPKTKVDVANVTALKALVYSEVEEGIAVVDENTDNIAWPWTDQFANTPSGFIYKQYVSEANADAVKVGGSLYGFTTEKEFMMDCVLKDWTPVPSSADQIFQPVVLNRAAAKIVLNVNFDADFLKSLTYNKKVDGETVTWEEKPEEEKITLDGTPGWRFYNFSFGAPVFAPETQGEGVEVHNSATLLRHPFTYDGDDKHFQIITYTYPHKWAQDDYATEAPSLVISVGYKTGSAATDFHYYRIPLVKYTVTSIERNHIYVVNATIATKGSDLQDDVDEIEDVVYNVLPWNDESNSAAIHNEVDAVQHLYLKVYPTVYTLRGDGEQSMIINYLKAAGTRVGWQLYTFNTTTETKGSPVASTANNAVWGWYYDGDGDMKTSYTGMTHMGVSFTQSTEGTSRNSGTITVKSTDLPNRAIKYILIRVYLIDSPSLYQDVIIRHFPTDNIQSIQSLWSSRTTSGWWAYSNGTGNNASGTKRDADVYGIATQNNLFSAKYYNNGYIYSYKGYWTNNDGLTNRNKYVVQISSTSDDYVLGRPYLDNYNQSDDHVVSPSFMIASQLGATQSKRPDNNQIQTYARAAANHCKTYKEVDSDGTEWTGWRLPTREEVGVILRYQKAGFDTMDPVLTGVYYWTLEGEAVATGVTRYGNTPAQDTWANNWATRYSNTNYDYPGYNGDGVNATRAAFIRCIRDMSATEIEKLNGFEEIIEKYQDQ